MRAVILCILFALGGVLAQELADAARHGSVADVAAAIAAGAAVDEVDEAGDTPLLLAVWHNTPDVVEALLDAGADPTFANGRTGMGIFGLVWRNPHGDAIRGVFRERGLVARVGVPQEPDGPTDGPAAESGGDARAPGAVGGAAPRARPSDAPPADAPPVDLPPLPLPSGAVNADRPTPDEAAALGFAPAAGPPRSRDEVRDWVTSRYALSGPLSAAHYLLGCQEAVLGQMRAPETVMFGDAGAVRLDDAGVISYETFALSQSATGTTQRWGVRCTGFVEADVLHLWLDIESR